jgi:Tol biopolymer transport system component
MTKKDDRLVLVDRQGRQNPQTIEPGILRYRPAFSPGGEQLAVNYRRGLTSSSEVWILDLRRGTFTPLTTGAPNIHPVWTPDGRRITFSSFKSDSFNLFWKLADGSAEVEPLLTQAYGQFPDSWSSDGKILSFHERNPNTGSDIWILHRDSARAEPLVVTPFNESSSSFSKDGRWLAYESDASGRYEVYVQPFPGPGRRSPVSTNGGHEPVWSPDGKELFYHTEDSMMVVEIETNPVFRSGVPHALFAWRFQPNEAGNEYDVSPDGRHFALVRRNQEVLVEVNVILDWVEELERMVPAE